MFKLNHEKILEKIDLLQNYNGYLPLALHHYVDLNYYDRVSDKVLKKYYKNRTQLQREGASSTFILDELEEWINKNPKFKDIIIYD